jgi:hypothetical protein
MLQFAAFKFSGRYSIHFCLLARAAHQFQFAASALSERFITTGNRVINGKLHVSAATSISFAANLFDEKQFFNDKSLLDAVTLSQCAAQPLSGRHLIAIQGHP